MKCTNCGAEMAPGSAFCGSCGTPAAKPQEQPQVQAPVQPEPQPQPVQQPQYQAPVQPQYQAPVQPQYQAPVYQAPAQPQVLANKKEYLAILASDKVKRNRKLAPILALVCAIVLVASYFMAMNTSLIELPMMSVVMPEDERESFEDQLDDALDQLDEAKDNMGVLEEEYSSKQINAVEDLLDITRDTAKTLSVSNLQKLTKAVEKAYDMGLEDELDIDDFEESAELFDLLANILLGGLIFVLFFTLLGGLCKSKGLILWGMIFSVLYTLPLAGVIFTVLSVVAHIVVFSMLASGDKEYRAYRKANRTH